jgi:hypothetical protein
MRSILCLTFAVLLLLGSGMGCKRDTKPGITPPDRVYELPGDPVAAGGGGPKPKEAGNKKAPPKDQPDEPGNKDPRDPR